MTLDSRNKDESTRERSRDLIATDRRVESGIAHDATEVILDHKVRVDQEPMHRHLPPLRVDLHPPESLPRLNTLHVPYRGTSLPTGYLHPSSSGKSAPLAASVISHLSLHAG